MKKKRVFSGIQPSGSPHIGNYLGAIKNWADGQDEKENIFCVVDLHAITTPQDPKELRANILETTKIIIASGVDPKNAAIFIQSDRPEHAELGWILNCNTGYGELQRMTQFKDKTNSEDMDHEISSIITKTEWQKLSDPIASYKRLKEVEKNYFDKYTVGLLAYPVLMAADILLYDTDEVPVGDDQKQHVELARAIAKRVNSRYKDAVVVPAPDIKPVAARIMSLDDPKKKMSKSAGSANSYIAIRDDADTIRRKIKKAVTDSGSEVVYAKDKPALANLLTIYSAFSGDKIEDIVKMYKGKGYAEFKQDLAEVVVQGLAPIQARLEDLDHNPEYVAQVLAEGSQKVAPIASATLTRVKSKIGLG